jgi:ketosteroid isomerase-like protein
MSQENVEIVRNGIAAWKRRDADLWLTYAAPEIEWVPAGPAAVRPEHRFRRLPRRRGTDHRSGHLAVPDQLEKNRKERLARSLGREEAGIWTFIVGLLLTTVGAIV